MEPVPQTPALEEEPEGLTEFDAEFKKQKEAIPSEIRLVIEKLAYQVTKNGLSLEEACLLKNIDIDWLERVIVLHPVIARILAQKELQFRVDLMKPLIAKAKVDEKMAQYLLELRTPDKKKNAKDPEEDASMLAAAVSFIQEHGDSTPLVRRESGMAVVVTGKKQNVGKLMEKIKNMLPTRTLV